MKSSDFVHGPEAASSSANAHWRTPFVIRIPVSMLIKESDVAAYRPAEWPRLAAFPVTGAGIPALPVGMFSRLRTIFPS